MQIILHFGEEKKRISPKSNIDKAIRHRVLVQLEDGKLEFFDKDNRGY